MSKRTGVAAFTLIEILMVLAILGLMAGLFITSAGALTGDRAATPEDLFWRGVTAARKRALLSRKDVQMTFIKSTKAEPTAALVLTNAEGEERVPFTAQGDVTLDFLSLQKGRSAILVGGELVETQTMPTVTFYADGTCTPFRAQIRTGGAPRSLSIDPWTCAAVLPTTEASR